MKKLTIVLVAVVVLILGFTSTVFAWDRAVGCTVDGYGNPWTHGGTVTCRQRTTNIVVGQGTLDANGCFSVFIGNGLEVRCTIDYNPGPLGDPADDLCIVPTDSSYLPAPWDCGTFSTGTGPNAVTLAGFGATSLPAGALALVLSVVVGGMAAFWRRR